MASPACGFAYHHMLTQTYFLWDGRRKAIFDTEAGPPRPASRYNRTSSPDPHPKPKPEPGGPAAARDQGAPPREPEGGLRALLHPPRVTWPRSHGPSPGPSPGPSHGPGGRVRATSCAIGAHDAPHGPAGSGKVVSINSDPASARLNIHTRNPDRPFTLKVAWLVHHNRRRA